MFITNKRKKLFLKLETVYFISDYREYKSDADIVLFYSTPIAKKGAREFNTQHIDLTKEERIIFYGMNGSSRRYVNVAAKSGLFSITLITSPSNVDIDDFCMFFDDFASIKGIKKADRNFIKMINEQGALTIMFLKHKDGRNLCGVLNIHDDERIFGMYAYSNFRNNEDSEYRRMVATANRYLYWNNIIKSKKSGFKLMDFGGLGLGIEDKSMDGVDYFKSGFGGAIVTEYHFYHPLTITGWLALLFARKKIAF